MEFYENFKTLLETNQIDECSTLYYSFEGFQLIEDYSWELTQLFCELLNKQTEEKTLEFIRQASLYLSSQFGNAKELFLIYLENAESFFAIDQNYFTLVDLIQVLLHRLSPKFVFYSIELAINQLRKNIAKKIDQPNVISLTNKYADFLSTFIELAVTDSSLKSLLITSLVNLFHEPLMTINLEDANTDNDEMVKKIINLISKLNTNFFKLILDLYHESELKTENAVKIAKSAIGSFLYSVYKYDRLKLPLVYTSFYELQTFAPILEDFLHQSQNQFALEKALITYTNILNRIEVMSLNANVLELKSIVESVQTLFKITVFSEIESIRKQTVEVIRTIFHRFNRLGRYTFLKYFLHDNLKNETLNNYISSFLVYLFKEELSDCFDKNETFYYYRVKDTERVNSDFKRLFNLITKLNHSANVIQESSKIIAILNLIRFLLIRDKDNSTGVKELLIVSDYLAQLDKTVKATKSNYEFDRHSITNAKIKKENDEDAKYEVTTQEGKLDEPTFDDKLKSVENALQSIELIESLITRSNELINEQN